MIRGNSGCQLEVHNSTHGMTVRKSTTDPHYAARLQQQARKQTDFQLWLQLPNISAPPVYGQYPGPSSFAFEMKFMPSIDAVSFLQLASRQELDFVADTMNQFIECAIARCELVPFPVAVFWEKFDQVRKQLLNEPILNYVEQVFHKTSFHTPLPVGYCHGDLTFSNVLVNKISRGLIFIDFLDTFIESPIQDMVKLRQDTQYAWSALLYLDRLDIARYRIAMTYLDNQLTNKFQQHDFYRAYYHVFQIMNIMRILCYCREAHERQFLRNCLQEVLREGYAMKQPLYG